MIAPSLYADLRSRSVELSIARTPDAKTAPELPPLRLKVRAPEGALNETMRRAIQLHRDELLQFVFELEETAAILQVMQGNRIEASEELSRDCVRGGRATPDGDLWLREYARLELERLGAQDASRKILGCELEVMEVRRVEAA